MNEELVILGRLDGAWGVKGWVRVYSYADPPAAIFDYQPWSLEGRESEIRVIEWRRAGPRLVARLEGVDTLEQADLLKHAAVRVARARFPELPEGQYYWRDLEGLDVINREGGVLGRVRGLMPTGAHDVLVVGGEAPVLIPFVPGTYVDEVDLEGGRILVDWSKDWVG